MINKVTSSPTFKSEVRVVYATQEENQRGVDVGKGPTLTNFNDKFYNSASMTKAIKEIKRDNRDNIVTFFPSRDEYGRPYMQMHVLNDDPDDGKSSIMARIYSPREILDQYSNIDQKRVQIDKESTGVYDYIG